MQEVLIILIFAAALAYLARLLYKNFKGEANCSANCGCESPAVKQYQANRSK